MEVKRYLKSLGLDPDIIEEVSISKSLVDKFPWKGIIFVGGRNHLNKTMSLCKMILETKTIFGSIDHLESWETGQYKVDHSSCALLVITNISKGLYFDNNLITELNQAFIKEVPILLTSCNEIEELEKEASKTLISVIEPYLTGMI